MLTLPVPMMNIVNGGAHANNTVDMPEFPVLILETDKLDHIHDMVDRLDLVERVEALLPWALQRP